MATFVLVPGAYSGAWYLKEEAALLEADGHHVHRCTLTGLGERIHLASPDVGLDTHVMDVVNVIRYEDLHDIILMGHSYGGMVITGAAEHVPEYIAHLVYLDAIVPSPGESVMSGDAQTRQAEFDKRLADGDGWRLPVDWEHGSKDWRRAPHPVKTFRDSLEITNAAAAALPRTYILCTADKKGGLYGRMLRTSERVQAEGWGYYEIDATHGVLRENPELVSRILLQVAAKL